MRPEDDSIVADRAATLAPSHQARPMRVLHYPANFGAHPSGLRDAERKLGIQSDLAVLGNSWLQYPADIDLNLARANRWRRLLGRAGFMMRSLRRYDVFHFNAGQTFLPLLRGHGIDLPMLRATGKTVFMTYQGCDARQVRFCANHYSNSCCGNQAGDGLCNRKDDGAKARAIQYVNRHAHKVFVTNPDLLRLVPDATFVPYALFDPLTIPAQPPRISDRPLRILHAPTNRAVKGTEFVDRARQHFQQRRVELEWIIIENLPHDEAMKRYAAADLVIDQLRVGWYGGFAVETMAMGKPVICYIRPEDRELIPPDMAADLPLIHAEPETLIEVMQSILNQREQLIDIGCRGRQFVMKWHDPIKIARRMIELYRDPSLEFWTEEMK